MAFAACGELGDRVIVARAQHGDHGAFTELVGRHERRLRTLAGRLLRDPEQVDDALQEVYIKAFRTIGRFRGDANVGTWLYRITYNTSCGGRGVGMPEELRTDRRQTDMEHEMQTEELRGRPDAESSVFVAVTSVDICTQPLGFSLGFREDLGDALDLDRLDAASLAATVQMRELGTAEARLARWTSSSSGPASGSRPRPASTSCSTTRGSG